MTCALSCLFINLLCQSYATPPPLHWKSTKQTDIQRQLLSLLLVRHSSRGQSEPRQGEGGGGGWKHNEHSHTTFPYSVIETKVFTGKQWSVVDIQIRLDKDECRLSLYYKNMKENSGEKIGLCSFHASKSANHICRSK